MASFSDLDFFLAANADQSKLLRFDCAAIPTGTLRVLSVPNTDGILALVDWSQTWSALQKFPDDKFNLVGSADATKILRFEVDGFTTATTRTLTVQDSDYTVAGIDITQTITAPQVYDSHNYFPGGTIEFRGDPGASVLGFTDAVTGPGTRGVGIAIPATGFSNTSGIYYLPDFTTLSETSAFVVWDSTGANPGGGAMLYGNNGGAPMNSLPIGAAGTILTSTGAAPQWSTNAAVVDITRTWATLQTFKDTTFKIVDDGDSSKTIQFSAGGASANADLTLVWAGTADRSVTVPDATCTLAGLTVAQEWDAVQTFDATAADSPVTIKGDSGSNPGLIKFTDESTGFAITVKGPTAGISANRTLQLPDGTGTVLFNNGTFIGTCSTAVVLTTSSASTGVAFTDTTTSTKKLRVVLSGAVGNNSFTIATTAARNYTFPDIAGTVAIGVGTAVNAASTDLATVIALCNQLRAILIANGQAV